ncbi:hypothetical protein M0R72_15300 [Candidatus Pacearchaeota archaeon]|jgi:hypothetical protein|nr:hypothetical protein [Candidatus Pacearchaeota archaeon]
MGLLNFGSKEKYRRWNAFGHISGVFERTPGNQSISIRGKPYKVRHCR